MLTGRLPFPGPAAMDVARQQLEPGALLDPREVAPDRNIPDNLAHACIRGLAQDPSLRFPDALTMAMAIAAPGNRALLRASRIPGRPAPSESEVRRAVTQATRRDRTTQQADAGEDDGAWLRRAPWAAELLSPERPILVWGPAGVGRSWMLTRALRELRQRGIVAERLEAPPAPLNQIGYGGLRKMLRRLARLVTDADVRAAVDGADTDDLRRALQRIFAKHGAIRQDPLTARSGATLALRWAIEQALRRQPAQLFWLALDDVDRMDGATLAAIAELTRGPKVPGLSLVLTAESDLEALLPPAVLRHQLCGWPRDQALERLGAQRGLLQRGDNDIEPMYVEQLMASFEDDSWSAPTTMNEAIEQRLRVLPPNALCTLQALAVCGPSPIQTLSEVVERAEDVSSSLLPLAKLGLIDVEDSQVRFTHELTARATLRLAPAGALAAVHEQAARIAERRGVGVELQAYHALRGRPDSAAFLLVEESVRLRLQRDDAASAISALEDGIEAARTLLLRDQDQIAKSGWLVFGSKLGELLRQVGRVRDAVRVLSETLDLTEPHSSARARLLGQLARIADSERRIVERELLAAEALRIATEVGETQLVEDLRHWGSAPPPPQERVIVESGPPEETQNVLVVEDDRELARALGRWLKRKGHVVTKCHSVAEAAELQGPYACGIFDVMLPDGSGLELAERLHDAGVVDALVFFTSSEEADVAVIAESLGEMVRKSRGLLELEAVVDAALRGSERAPTPEVA